MTKKQKIVNEMIKQIELGCPRHLICDTVLLAIISMLALVLSTISSSGNTDKLVQAEKEAIDFCFKNDSTAFNCYVYRHTKDWRIPRWKNEKTSESGNHNMYEIPGKFDRNYDTHFYRVIYCQGRYGGSRYNFLEKTKYSFEINESQTYVADCNRAIKRWSKEGKIEIR